jgi:two-component system, cell cycle sensor histidine kinase and response regulator CckA
LENGHSARVLLEEVIQASTRAANIVAQLLAYGRRQILRPAFLEVNDVITHLMKMLERLIGENIQLNSVLGSHVDTVYADRGMVEQVLMNLCINARDSMPNGGILTIASGNIFFDEADCERQPWAKPGAFVFMSIMDTGCGMDPDTLKQIFEPFFTTKGVGKGTGLGLSTVYGIISQHNGLIHAQSVPGKGTTISVFLPARKNAALLQEMESEAPIPGGNEIILLAEDDESVRKLVRTVLEKAGYTVMEASNGVEAERLFKGHSQTIDLLLLDVIMPEMGGRAVFDKAKDIKPSIRALFASGFSEDAIHTNFILEEGLNFVQKPYERKLLLKRVREVLDAS